MQHLTVGNTTPMHGKFFTGLWEDVTSDIDVRTLIHGYNLVMWDGENGTYVHDPSVVNAIGIMDNEAGDRAYLIALQDDLFYSNVYFDFYSPQLQDYNISQNESWGQAIVGAYLGEKVEEDFVIDDGDYDEFEDFAGFEFFDDEEGGGEFFFIDDDL